MIDKSEIVETAERIRPYLQPTPLVKAHYYSSLLSAEVYFKLESLQPTRSFKVRGAFNAALARTAEERDRGLMTATGGNHGLALAYAAQRLSVPASIFVPETTSKSRQDLIRSFGAEVTVYGRSWDDTNQHALSTAREENWVYIHPFNDRRMIAGAATIFKEIIEQLGPVDLVVASIGGGGLVSGLISARDSYLPRSGSRTRIVGVETLGTDSMYQSLRRGCIVELEKISSIVTSLAARRPGDLTFDITRQGISDLVTVTDEEAVAAAFDILEHEKLLVEPAASCCLAALTGGSIPVKEGEKIVVIICGANSSLQELLQYQQLFQ